MTQSLSELPWIAADTTDLYELQQAREQNWVAQSSRGLEVLTYEQGFEVLEHPELEKGPSFRRRLDDVGIVDGEIRDLWNLMLVNNEGAYRKKLRVPLASLFRPAQVAKLRVHVRTIVNEILDEIGDPGSVDLMQELCWRVPPMMYCHLVSAPVELAPTVARLSDSILAPILTADPTRRQESVDAFLEGWEFVRDHIEARRQNIGNDFTSVMIKQQIEGLLTEDQLMAEGMSILQASVDNTVHQMGNTFGTLLQEPSRWQQLLDNPDASTPIIEEVIRLRPRFGTIFRYAPHEITVDDQVIPADSFVYVSVRSAQRDARVFSDPNTYNIDRPAKRPLMFGAGPYNCLGQNLARMEIEEALKAVAERFPKIRLTEEWTCHDTNAVTETANLKVSLG